MRQLKGRFEDNSCVGNKTDAVLDAARVHRYGEGGAPQDSCVCAVPVRKRPHLSTKDCQNILRQHNPRCLRLRQRGARPLVRRVPRRTAPPRLVLAVGERVASNASMTLPRLARPPVQRGRFDEVGEWLRSLAALSRSVDLVTGAASPKVTVGMSLEAVLSAGAAKTSRNDVECSCDGAVCGWSCLNRT